MRPTLKEDGGRRMRVVALRGCTGMPREHVIALAETLEDCSDGSKSNILHDLTREDDHTPHQAAPGASEPRVFTRRGLLDLRHVEPKFWLEAVQRVEGDCTLPGDLDVLAGALRIIVPTHRAQLSEVKINVKPRTRTLVQITQRGPRELRTLNLKESRICKLAQDIIMCKGLNTLILQKNNLAKLPDEIGQLSRLTVLDVSHNKLRSLSSSVGRLSAMLELNLSHNMLHCLPASIAQMSRLRELRISNNMIRNIPRDFGSLQQLSSLDAANNLLQYLPAELNDIRTLRRISLQGNPLVVPSLGGPKSQNISWPSQESTLYEAACRMVLCCKEGKAPVLTTSLRLTLKAAQKCNFCSGPFIRSLTVCIRFLRKNNLEVPFASYLCCKHWGDERSRIQAIFSGIPATLPDADLWRIRQFGISHGARPQSTLHVSSSSPSEPSILEGQVRLSLAELLPVINQELLCSREQ